MKTVCRGGGRGLAKLQGGHGLERCFSKGEELLADELFALFVVPGVAVCSGGRAGGGKA